MIDNFIKQTCYENDLAVNIIHGKYNGKKIFILEFEGDAGVEKAKLASKKIKDKYLFKDKSILQISCVYKNVWV